MVNSFRTTSPVFFFVPVSVPTCLRCGCALIPAGTNTISYISIHLLAFPIIIHQSFTTLLLWIGLVYLVSVSFHCITTCTPSIRYHTQPFFINIFSVFLQILFKCLNLMPVTTCPLFKAFFLIRCSNFYCPFILSFPCLSLFFCLRRSQHHDRSTIHSSPPSIFFSCCFYLLSWCGSTLTSLLPLVAVVTLIVQVLWLKKLLCFVVLLCPLSSSCTHLGH